MQYDKIIKEIARFFKKQNFTTKTIQGHRLVTNAAMPNFEYITDRKRLKNFQRWSTGIIKRATIDTRGWFGGDLDLIYKRGTEIVQQELKIDVVQDYEQLEIHRSTLSLIKLRVLKQFDYIPDNVGNTITNILAKGLVEGDGVKAIGRKVRDRLNIERYRAFRLVRTELGRAHNLSKVAEAVERERRTGRKVNFTWIAVGDAKTRSTHKKRNKKRYSKEDVVLMSGEVNCRCVPTATRKEPTRKFNAGAGY